MSIYLALGSNLGDRKQYLVQGLAQLQHLPGVTVLQTSMIYETAPVAMATPDAQPFLNLVCEVDTLLEPAHLVQQCQAIERRFGRVRHPGIKNESRTLDIDLLLYHNETLASGDLEVPHPRLHERAFVLVPLMELAPEMVHPTLGKTMLQLHWQLENPEQVELFDVITEAEIGN